MKPAPAPVGTTNEGELVFVCPLCEDRSGHLRMDPDRNVWYCLRHAEGGTITGLRKRTGIEWPVSKDAFRYRDSDRECVQSILNKAFDIAGVPSPFEKVRKKPPVDYEKLCAMPCAVSAQQAEKGGLGRVSLLLPIEGVGRAWYDSRQDTSLPPAPWDTAVRGAWYARARGITFDEACALHMLAVCDPLAVGARLRYFGRIVFPFYSPQTRIMRAFQARDVAGFAKQKYLGPKAPPKAPMIFYAPRAAVAASCRILRAPVLVEGVMDAIAVERAGLPAVALCGKNLSSDQYTELVELGMERPYVFFDSETAAQAKARKLCGKLLTAGLRPSFVSLGRGDPGDATVDEIRTAMAAASKVDGETQLASMVGGVVGALLKRH